MHMLELHRMLFELSGAMLLCCKTTTRIKTKYSYFNSHVSTPLASERQLEFWISGSLRHSLKQAQSQSPRTILGGHHDVNALSLSIGIASPHVIPRTLYVIVRSAGM